MSETAEKLRFVDVSGIGSSGKSAVVDMLREFDSVFAPHFQFEFDLLRVSGGLLDLRHAVTEDWSPVRSHTAIKRFREKLRIMGADPKKHDLFGLLESSGQRYSKAFGPQYFELFDRLCDELIIGTYQAEWPYEELEFSGLKRLAVRLARRFGFRAQMRHDVLLVDGSGFDDRVANLMRELYAPLISEGQNLAVLNNGIEPFNPSPGLDMIGSGTRQIIVIRDPRDIYASGLTQAKGNLSQLQSFDNDGFNKGFLATDDLELFCARMELHLKNVSQNNDPRVLTVWFEDLVQDYEATRKSIAAFLNLDLADQTQPRSKFDPSKSAKMVGVSAKLPDQRPIQYISDRLQPYLYPDPTA